MSRYPQTVTVETNSSIAEATKEAQGEPWEIGYPDRNDRFYGTRTQVHTRMEKALTAWDKSEEESA